MKVYEPDYKSWELQFFYRNYSHDYNDVFLFYFMELDLV